MEVKKELWLTNLSKADVSLSDLGIKVSVGKTINVYAANPYLTREQVDKSMTTGALFKRLSGDNPVLKIVKSGAKKSAMLSKLKQDKGSFKIKKVKSSITIDNADELTADQGEAFDFADYGIGDLNTKSDRVKEQASVFVKAKEDPLTVALPESDVVNVPKVDGNMSKQSTIVMETMTKNLVNPVGPLADMKTNKNNPYVVTAPAAKENDPVEVPKSKTKINKEDGSILVGAAKDTKNNKTKVNTVKRSNNSDENVIEFDNVKIDAKVATKTQDGHVVMELKEVSKDISGEKAKVKPSKKK